MGVQGPIARGAEDLELALSVLAGPDVGEDVAWRVELPAARRERLADFRVGVLPPIPWLALDDRIASALEDVAARLARLGCAVKRVQPEGVGDWREHYRALPQLLVGGDGRGDAGGAATADSGGTGSTTTSSRGRARAGSRRRRRVLLWIARGSSTVRRGARSSAKWDVLLAPAIQHARVSARRAAVPMDESDFTLTLTIDGKPAPYMRCLVYPSVATVAGQPATAFPVGRSREGLPIGLQAIGPYLEDRTPIRFAALLAREIGGFTRPDGYDG